MSDCVRVCSRAALLAAAGVLAAGLAGCGSSSGSSGSSDSMSMDGSMSRSSDMSMPASSDASSGSGTPTPLSISVDAKGGVSGVPATLAAGTYAMSAQPADTKSQYQVQFVRLSPGYTQAQLFSDVAKGLMGDKPDTAAVARVYSKATLVGGPAGPGAARSDVFLPAGNYVYVNTDVQGQPTPKTLTVTSGATEAALPATDVTVTAKGDAAGMFTFDVDGSLADGGQLTFTNASEDNAHFLAIEKVKSGHTAAQCEAYEGDPSDAKSPCDLVLASTVVSPGSSETASFAAHGAGTYLLACFLPDPKTGKLHAMEGMLKTIKVS